MIPGFVTIYTDKDKYKHLYFYPGLSDEDEPIYRNIELPDCQLKYDKIIKIICHLVRINGDTDINVLSFK